MSEQRSRTTRPSGAGEVGALLGWRARRVPGGALLIGLAGTVQPLVGLGSSPCAPRGPVPRDGCEREAPAVHSVGVVGGWEAQRGRGFSARLLAGPAYYRASDEWGRALGLQGRLDLATPTVLHVALLASARGAVLPRVHGERFIHGAYGFGLRIQ